MTLELKRLRVHPFASLFHKVTLFGKKLSYWDFLSYELNTDFKKSFFIPEVAARHFLVPKLQTGDIKEQGSPELLQLK